MEGIERLTEMVKQLVEQVKLLSETLKLSVDRQEQLYQAQQAQLPLLPQLVERQTLAVEELEVSNQSLEDSIGGVDQAANDIVKATSVLVTIVQPALQALARQAVEQTA